MTRFLFLIDPLEKLNIKKDSSLLWAHTLQKMGKEVYVIFKENLHFLSGNSELTWKAFSFSSLLLENSYYLKEFLVEKKATRLLVSESDHVIFRLDPPFDTTYLQVLLLLEEMKNKVGFTVENSALSIVSYNEKLLAYGFEEISGHDSYIGLDRDELSLQIKKWKENSVESVIFKPLNSFSGIGIEKHSVDQAIFEFENYKKSLDGNIPIVQPFYEIVERGEIRAIFYNGVYLGSILKKPVEGDFITNIAAGGSYEAVSIDPGLELSLKKISLKLRDKGLNLLGYDILDGRITEINVTCPGLLVELSMALGKNITEKLVS